MVVLGLVCNCFSMVVCFLGGSWLLMKVCNWVLLGGRVVGVGLRGWFIVLFVLG